MIMASKASKVRIVRCPKCHKFLTEFPDVPVYKCGGCGTVLKAKKYLDNKQNGASNMLDSSSSEKNPLQHVPDVGESSNDVATFLNKQSASFPKVVNNGEVDHMVEHKHIAVSSDESLSSSSETDYCIEGKLSKFTENENMKPGLAHDNLCSIQNPGLMGENPVLGDSDQQGRGVQSNIDSCSNEQLDDSWKLNRHESGNSRSSGKTEAIDSHVPEEDLVNGDPVNGSSEKMYSPTVGSSYTFDGAVSSCDHVSITHEQDLHSSRTVINHEISDPKDPKVQERVEDTVLENMGVELKQDIQLSILSSESEGEGHSCPIFDSSASNQRLSLSHVCYQETSQPSEIFHSARKELEDDSLSRSLSSNFSCENFQWNGQSDGSTKLRNLENDRMELLRKVDELRDHLTRPYARGHEGNQSFNAQGKKQDHHGPLLHNHGSEHVLQCCNSNITQSHPRVFGQRAMAQHYQSRVPFSAQSNCSFLHHHPKDCCIPVRVPPIVCCRACKCHILRHSSTAANPTFCIDCDAALNLHNSQTTEQNFGKQRCKGKRQPHRRHFRPVSGGSPFVICNNCSQLLQLPADFLISRARCHKLKCGACSKVTIFLSHDGGHIVPHRSTQLDPAPSEVDNEAGHVGRCELPADSYYGCPQQDPVSYSEQYDPPFSFDYSTDGDPVLHILRSSIEYKGRRHGKDAIDSLHHLMGYASASELIYQPTDEDKAYESTDMADEIHSNGAERGTPMGSPLQENSERWCSLEHTKRQKEDRSVKRSTKEGGASSLHGLFKKGIKELNHGLENMKFVMRKL